MFFIFLCFCSYLVGAIPFGLLIAKLFKLNDPRKFASGNIGASNMARLGGAKVGILTFLLDFTKALVPTLLAKHFYSGDSNLSNAGIIGLFSVIGHCYPAYLKFQGGKGVASAAGLMFALQPLVTLGGLFIWGICFLITKITSLSALIACAVVLLFCGQQNGFSSFLCLLTLGVVLLITYRHKTNIKALLTNSERSFKKQN